MDFLFRVSLTAMLSNTLCRWELNLFSYFWLHRLNGVCTWPCIVTVVSHDTCFQTCSPGRSVQSVKWKRRQAFIWRYCTNFYALELNVACAMTGMLCLYAFKCLCCKYCSLSQHDHMSIHIHVLGVMLFIWFKQ